MLHKVYLLTRGWNIKVIDLYLNYLLEYLRLLCIYSKLFNFRRFKVKKVFYICIFLYHYLFIVTIGFFSVKLNNLVSVKQFLESGTDINSVDDNGNTALYFAVFINSLDMTKLLIENNANVNAAANDGYTPLMEAANNKHNIKIAKLLIENNADVNAKNNNGFLHLLCVL